MFTFFKKGMFGLAIGILIVGFLINYIVIQYLVNYPLNPNYIGGKQGKVGSKGTTGKKGKIGHIGPIGLRGESGPVGETGKKGFIGVRGQLFKFGNTTEECMNNENCDWSKPSEYWLDKVKKLEKDPHRVSSTFRYRDGSSKQDNLKDFQRGNRAVEKNINNNDPIIQLRPCVTCDHCDPPAPWDSLLGNPHL